MGFFMVFAQIYDPGFREKQAQEDQWRVKRGYRCGEEMNGLKLGDPSSFPVGYDSSIIWKEVSNITNTSFS